MRITRMSTAGQSISTGIPEARRLRPVATSGLGGFDVAGGLGALGGE